MQNHFDIKCELVQLGTFECQKILSSTDAMCIQNMFIQNRVNTYKFEEITVSKTSIYIIFK